MKTIMDNRAKEKAEELVFFYKNLLSPIVYNEMNDFFIARCVKCALICVEEILKTDPHEFIYNGVYGEWVSKRKYWEEVKEYLNNIKFKQ